MGIQPDQPYQYREGRRSVEAVKTCSPASCEASGLRHFLGRLFESKVHAHLRPKHYSVQYALRRAAAQRVKYTPVALSREHDEIRRPSGRLTKDFGYGVAVDHSLVPPVSRMVRQK